MKIMTSHVLRQSVFSMDGWCLWDPSLVKDADGEYHLFFSRWPVDKGFEAWVTHSEVCMANAETPLGPYHFDKVVLPRRPGFWDADVTHNPTIKRFDNKYYIYYNGNHGDNDWWNHRNNQRIGVAVADSPGGAWMRFDKPLLDVTAGAWDSKVTTNPSCSQTLDGKFILIYKGVGDAFPGPKYGPVLQGVAFADLPLGPFLKHPEPVLAVSGAMFSGEDPFVWCAGGRYFALLKDMDRFYSTSSRAIVLFESEDGVNWRLSENPIFQERCIVYEDGSREEVHRMERPFLYIEDGEADTFFCGVKPKADRPESIIVSMACVKN